MCSIALKLTNIIDKMLFSFLTIITYALPQLFKSDDLTRFWKIRHPSLTFNFLIKSPANLLKLLIQVFAVLLCESWINDGKKMQLIDELINLNFGLLFEVYLLQIFSIFLADHA
jgi:hypothetical protein